MSVNRCALMNYETFFQRVAGHAPYPYQLRIGTSPWPEIVDVPTGLGKTAAVVCAWLWKWLNRDGETGRRLVYCLPMRVLVEQTADAARSWCERSAGLFTDDSVRVPSVHVLMGGEVDGSWDVAPEAPAILVGTQDMLLSRALNRGYGMNRYRWPIHYALLNNDCVWVFDETQIMGVAVETSAQLAAFRNSFGGSGPCKSVWMSATLGREQLRTVDHPEPPQGWIAHSLDTTDLAHAAVAKKTTAQKAVQQAPMGLTPDSQTGYAAALADWVAERHRSRRGLTLVVVNRVKRAQEIYAALRARDDLSIDSIALIHSRFRPADRERAQELLHADRDRIVVATQALEAGVDVSARTLITELAPWPSLVQRFGRCNRYGEQDDAEIWWADILADDVDLALPYSSEDLAIARDLLRHLPGGDAGPRSLATLRYRAAPIVRPIIRRRDLLDLFDTTPDLYGNDLDVSRFVRDGDDTDVSFFWRALEEGGPASDLHGPSRDELCRVSIAGANTFLKLVAAARKKSSPDERAGSTAYRWQARTGVWESADSARPGDVILLDRRAGGYCPKLGWTGEQLARGAIVQPLAETGEGAAVGEALHGDPASSLNRWVRLGSHLGHVEREASLIGDELDLGELHRAVVAEAGRWHDVGKAHAEFQRRLVEPAADDPQTRAPAADALWAKSGHRKRARHSERAAFRHELASALAWLAEHSYERSLRVDLIAYLVAAHHGKVRMSIRSEPTETAPPEPGRRYARGVWDRDLLPTISLPDGAHIGPFELELGIMQMGADSWLERTLALRDRPDLGPFRLALLEAVVRAADWRASHKESTRDYDD